MQENLIICVYDQCEKKPSCQFRHTLNGQSLCWAGTKVCICKNIEKTIQQMYDRLELKLIMEEYSRRE